MSELKQAVKRRLRGCILVRNHLWTFQAQLVCVAPAVCLIAAKATGLGLTPQPAAVKSSCGKIFVGAALPILLLQSLWEAAVFHGVQRT